MNAYITFGENLSNYSHDIERKRNSGVNQGPYLWHKSSKLMCNNPNVDHVNTCSNARTKCINSIKFFLRY